MSFGQKTVWSQGLTEQSATALEELGVKRSDVDSDGYKEYKYVQFNNGSGNVASATNMVVYELISGDTGGTIVTNDVSDSDINHVAGVMPLAMTDLYYGWMQVCGYNSAIRTDGGDDIAAADALIGGGDGTCNSVAQDTAPTNKVLGFAVAADVDASNTVAGKITVGA